MRSNWAVKWFYTHCPLRIAYVKGPDVKPMRSLLILSDHVHRAKKIPQRYEQPKVSWGSFWSFQVLQTQVMRWNSVNGFLKVSKRYPKLVARVTVEMDRGKRERLGGEKGGLQMQRGSWPPGLDEPPPYKKMEMIWCLPPRGAQWPYVTYRHHLE